jgi:hypothetical protein
MASLKWRGRYWPNDLASPISPPIGACPVRGSAGCRHTFNAINQEDGFGCQVVMSDYHRTIIRVAALCP